jgi:tRNA wybutosine-synthesizing protein 3
MYVNLFMDFEKNKKIYMTRLYKPDKSTKGNVDLEISDLIDMINSFDCYYTTSSCSGRILLIDINNKQRKKNANWIYVTHSKASLIKINKCLSFLPKDLPKSRQVWFVQEPLILHICAKDIESAQKIIDSARNTGLKRSGIFSIRPNRVMIEIIGCDKMEVPVFYDGKFQINSEYLKTLVKIANEKMKKTFKINDSFFESLKKIK